MFLNKLGRIFPLFLSQLAFIVAAQAQTISSVRIDTSPSGLEFYVDGQLFTGPATLLWPQGSKHSLSTPVAQSSGALAKTRYALQGWNSNLGVPTDMMTITADPSLTWITATFTTQYAVDLTYYVCPPGTSTTTCPSISPGSVIVAGTTFFQNGETWVNAGASVTVQAIPNSGWVFVGWLQSSTPASNGSAFINTYVVNWPITLYPQFLQARPVSVSIVTSPPGLQVLLDHTPSYSPITLQWGMNTTHALAGISPQTDLQGKLWVFSSWSDQGAYSHNYTVPYAQGAITLTATYVPGVVVGFYTNPPGLSLTVDGNSNSLNYSFAWALGTAHTVTAPPTETDLTGHKYQFVSWSNNGPETQQIKASTDPTANRYTANYQMIGTVAIQSNPGGVPVQVDGQPCTTPCSVDRPVGTAVQVSAPASTSPGDGARLDFQGWADGASVTRTLTAAPDLQTVTANYQLRYQLVASASPATGVNWRTQPASPDLFFDAQSQVTVSANAKPGFQFLHWAGDASGSTPTATLMMNGPHNVRAELDTVPYIDPSGIENSAAATPDNTVAPGSAVAIYGLNLSSDVVLAHNGLVSQTLDNVVVHSGDALLPLFFVSPGQINVQLPSSVPEGKQTLTVHVKGKPDASADFTVVRNAPGLFATATDTGAFAIAAHQDGSLISAKSPARRGEVVTLYGTGLGPYNPMPLDGFPVPADSKYPLADAAKVMVGSVGINPVWAGAAAGRIAVAVVEFKIDNSVPHATTVSLKVRVNGHDSNTVLLPVE
jgi:uncharacterized protein (TIGR03437 family)